jgi:hypothetical protein
VISGCKQNIQENPNRPIVLEKETRKPEDTINHNRKA